MIFLVVTLLVVPRKYMSEGKLFVSLGRGGVTLDPTVTTSQTVQIQETRESEINSVADILESRALTEKVVKDIGMDRFFETNFIFADLVKLPAIEFPSFSSGSVEDELLNEDGEKVDFKMLKRREKAMRRFESSVKIKPTKKAATISVVYKAASPKLAKDIVDSILTNYQDMHIRAHRTDGSFRFFEDQLSVQKKELENAQNSLRDFKNKTGITSIDGQRNSVQMQMDKIAAFAIDTEAQIAGVRERIGGLLGDYSSLKQDLVTESVKGNANEGNDLMRTRLFDLEVRYKDLSARFYPGHPEVEMVKQAMEKTRSVYKDQPYDRLEVKTSVNPTKLALEERLLFAKSELKEQEAVRDQLKKREIKLAAVLEQLNKDEASLEVLARNAEVAKASYKTYAEKMEEARISHELDRERISNVKVVQPATLVVKAVSPKRMLLALLGSVFFFLTSLLLAYLLEVFDSSLRSSDDLARQIDTPILVTLPKLASKRALTGLTEAN